jgi:phosphatidylinositol dimannoside acyltransferase
MAGRVMAGVWRDRRPIVAANLRRVVGPGVSDAELDRLVLRAFESYARYWVESARLPTMGPAEVLRRFSIEGFEQFEREMGKHRGAIMALPHFGAWELGGLWLTLKGYPMTTVAEPLDPPDLFDWFRQQRESFGLTIYTFDQGTLGRLAAALRAGRLVGLVADRDITGHGIEVDFFGERTTLPAGPALLAIRTGAPLLPTIVFQLPGGKGRGVIGPPLEIERTGDLRHDMATLTQAIAREFEGLIHRAPEQWHMFQANWPSDRVSAVQKP